MLKAKFKMSYKDEKKRLMHIYVIDGPAEELAAYVTAKTEELAAIGKELPTDDVTGKPLFFTQFIDQDVLTIERNERSGKYYSEGCPQLKLLRDKLAGLNEAGASDREINRIEDRILDRELEISLERDKRKKAPVKQEDENGAPGKTL